MSPARRASLSLLWAKRKACKKEPGALVSPGPLQPLICSKLAGEGAAAAAAALDVRVVDGEAGAHEAVDVVELAAHDVGDAHRVDGELDALGLEDLVVGGDLVVEVDVVLEAGAAAGPDADAEREILLALLRHEALDLLRCVVGNANDGGLFALLHQHLPCCRGMVCWRIITPPTVYFNAPYEAPFGAPRRPCPAAP